MVRVILGGGSRAPYGQRQFHPLYAAAERHGLCEYLWGRRRDPPLSMARLEFDLRSGAALFDSKLQVRIYAVEVRDGSLPRELALCGHETHDRRSDGGKWGNPGLTPSSATPCNVARNAALWQLGERREAPPPSAIDEQTAPHPPNRPCPAAAPARLARIDRRVSGRMPAGHRPSRLRQRPLVPNAVRSAPDRSAGNSGRSATSRRFPSPRRATSGRSQARSSPAGSIRHGSGPQ